MRLRPRGQGKIPIQNMRGEYTELFGGMTLKKGRQEEYFFSSLRNRHPELLARYEQIYKGDEWGQATGEYDRQRMRSISDKIDFVSKQELEVVKFIHPKILRY